MSNFRPRCVEPVSKVCRMSVEFQEKTKAVVTVAEMARMLGLSRARFYQLIGTALPYPIFDVRTRRPFYSEEQQRVCLEVRRRNCGIDGKPILFYARRGGAPSSPTRKRSSRNPNRAKNTSPSSTPCDRSAWSMRAPTKSDRPSRFCSLGASSRRIRRKSSEGFSFIFSVRIVPIMSGDNSPYQPS